MPIDHIYIKGAAQHNLKHIDVAIPRDRFVVITGVSGSGKSSLAFDTLYAEGQRRYVESLSAYARQFLGQMDKPEVESIEGLSPAIAIEQKSASKNPRSTVATVTEIHDYLRLLFGRAGKPYCYKCGKPIQNQAHEQMVDEIMAMPGGTKFYLLAPIARGKKGTFKEELKRLQREGFARSIIDGIEYELNEEIELNKNKKHDIFVIVDRLVIKDNLSRRLADSLDTALALGGGSAVLRAVNGDEDEVDKVFSEQFACPDCNISYPDIEPRLFSFNAPYGACPDCSGLGYRMAVSEDLIIPDPSLTLRQGAVRPWNRGDDSYIWQFLEQLGKHLKFDLDTPWKKLTKKVRKTLLYGSDGKKYPFKYQGKGMSHEYSTNVEGVIPRLNRMYRQTNSEEMREHYYGRYFEKESCSTCNGARLRPEALAVRIGDKNIAEVVALSIEDALDYFGNVKLSDNQRIIASEILKEINGRLSFLKSVGLSYLTMDRAAPTLSGGEAQRIRLATQIGSGLMGVLYILDEPSIGLHQRDNARLLDTLKGLRDLGNTVIVVEHDEQTIRDADFIVDLGPGAGVHGGEIVVAGTIEDVLDTPDSLTGKYLNGEEYIGPVGDRRKSNGKFVTVKGCRQNNLHAIDAAFPVGCFVAVTGVSGSGKSSLVVETLLPLLKRHLTHSPVRPGANDGITGLENIDKVIEIDQQPIGRTPRSNPTTYTKAFDPIRQLFGNLTESKARGYKPGRFSFNVKGGRCEACSGDGIIKVEMHFLPDVYIPCEVCDGKRYNRETLEIKYKGKNIADILGMTVEEALAFFEAHPKIVRILQTLYDVGLGYIRMGQPAPTLSGGEAQRIKLSRELAKRSTGRTLYILDEPTTGLHFDDVKKLLNILQRLTDGGNTVIVIEHNLDVIKSADHIIDLGPEGGDAGGRLVAAGTPEEVAKVKKSYTGQFLEKII
ncbi:MAG: excinuclease ABC subunit UvrA [bacterium]|nr:excinuclease ABC subunit UvrA [bacterium]